MNIYNRLYSRDSKGKVREWKIEVQGNSYRTISGLINGEKVISEYTVCKPKNVGKKNETTAEQQAVLEAKAHWDKKIKTGYFESVNEIDNETYFEPMLAKNFNDYKDKIDWSDGVAVQIKYNGSRAIVRKEGIFTRKGERYLSVPHIEEYFQPFFKARPKSILDGELFNFKLRSQLNELMSIVRKTVNITEEDLKKSREKVRFYIYDGIIEDMSVDYLGRKYAIDSIFGPTYGDGVVEKVPTFNVNSQEEFEKLYKSFLEEGHEGAMIRILKKPYENKRSKYLLKVKPEFDSEGIILDILEGDGNWAGTGKVIRLKWKDKEFNATFKGEYEQAVEFLRDKKKWIGKEVTFLYNDLTGLGVPNFARVDINNCIKK